MINDRFYKIFNKLPILGMIHLAGDNPVRRALEELTIYEKEGVDGAIIENYHGTVDDVINTLKETSKRKSNLVIGINILPNEFWLSLPLAEKYKAKFVQLDYVAGKYISGELDFEDYKKIKGQHPEIVVLGGVWPKYYTPVEGSNLEYDLKEGMKNSEAIVVTGEATGKATPLDKIKNFRQICGEHPLIVGAGLNPDNAYGQLMLADGAIVGSTFKLWNDTRNKLDSGEVKAFMDVVKQVRKDKY